MKRGNFRKSRGFTMIEITVIMCIVAAMVIFAAVAMWSSASNFRFNAATSKALSDIRFTQHMARSHNGWYGIEFYVDPTNRFHVYSTDGTTDTDVADPARPSNYLVVDLNTDYGVKISAVGIGGGTKVEFNPLGTPYLDKSGAALASTGTITLSQGSDTKTIQIFKNTGKVELQ